ncbi:MAG: molybdenum cofactor guanylyltransferase, partial [Planctomycetota bacterium]|nr:molybdenum cofactor guanylyltransferase [Planctomycetota bacterium]
MTAPEGRAWGAILAGGRGSRMGADKALLRIGGRTLIERAAGAMAEVFGDRLLIVTDRPDRFAGMALPRVATDLVPGAGPLGGLLTALREVGDAPVFAVACDMPGLDPAVMRAQLDLWRDGEADALVPVAAGRPQPLHAIYSRVCIGIAEKLLPSG